MKGKQENQEAKPAMARFGFHIFYKTKEGKVFYIYGSTFLTS